MTNNSTDQSNLLINNQKASQSNSIIELFASFGMAREYARIYEICYLYPQVTVAKISELTGTNRTTLYSQIAKLIEANLITKVEDGWKQFLVARDLEFIRTNIESQIQNSQKLLQTKKMELECDINKILIYSDIMSIKECYYSLLGQVTTTDFYYLNGNITDWYNLDKVFFGKFIRERDELCKKNNIVIKAILDSGQSNNSKQKIDYEKFYKGVENFDYKYINALIYTSNTIITRGLILIHIIPDNKVIMSTNAFLIQSYKTNFEILWGSLK